MRAFNFNVNAFGKKVAVSAFANGAASALDLLSFLVVVRILSAEEVGIFLIALMIGTGVLRLGSPNLAHVIIRAATRSIEQGNPRDLRFILDIGLLCDAALIIFALAVGMCTALVLVPDAHLAVFASVMMAVVVNSIRPQVLSIAIPRAFDHHQALYLWTLAGAALKVGLLLGAWLLGGGFVMVVLAFCVWQAVPAVAGLVLMVRDSKGQGAISARRSTNADFFQNHPDLVPLLRDGTLTALPQLVFVLATPIVGFLGGVINAGIFGLAFKVGQLSRIYADPLSLTLYTEQCRAVESGKSGQLARRTVIWAAGLGGITALAAAAFKLIDVPFVTLAFGSDYVAAIPAIQWCIIAAIPTTVARPFQFGLFALGRANRVLQAETISAVAFLGLLAMMSGQAETAAVALAASRLVSAMACVYYFLRDTGELGHTHGSTTEAPVTRTSKTGSNFD